MNDKYVQWKHLHINDEEIYDICIKQQEEIERLNKELEEKEAILGGIQQLEAEVERLNNIINELEKYLIEQVEKSYSNDYDNVLDKLDELKGGESNE